MTAEDESIRSLEVLGFTALEAEAYVCLLRESPATGYRVAQALGRPVAGVYKALDSLAQKGAVLVDEGASRLCRAVPAEELLVGLERGFAERRKAAAEALSEVREAEDDDRVYRLRTRGQVMERCRRMLAGCQSLALLDIWPAPLEELQEEVEAAVRRGVRVAIQAYGPAEVQGARVIPTAIPQQTLEALPKPWVILVADGAEHLLAFLDPEGAEVRQAVWSGSPYLSWTLQAFMVSEFNFAAVLNDPTAGEAARDALRKQGQFYPMDTPGYRALLQRLTRDRS